MTPTTPRPWGGRRAQQLVTATLTTKGRTCHLCGLGGANSADHEPARSVLIRAGITNPDQLRYLHPAHLACNHRRNDRPITEALREELRTLMLKAHRVGNYAPRRSARFDRLLGGS
jgi:hypothetical protein